MKTKLQTEILTLVRDLQDRRATLEALDQSAKTLFAQSQAARDEQTYTAVLGRIRDLLRRGLV